MRETIKRCKKMKRRIRIEKFLINKKEKEICIDQPFFETDRYTSNMPRDYSLKYTSVIIYRRYCVVENLRNRKERYASIILISIAYHRDMKEI